MKSSLFNLNDIVYYLGRLYRVMGWGISGPHTGKLYLRLCGWEYSYGNWGCEYWGTPIPTVAWVAPGCSLLYHA